YQHDDLEVLTGSTHVMPGFLPLRDEDLAVSRAHHFLDDHRVGAWRHHCAGHHAHAFPRAHLAAERPAGERGPDFGQDPLLALQVGRADRVAIHGRVVVRRDVDPGHDFFGQHPAERFADLDGLGLGDGDEAAADRLARLVDVQGVRVVAVEAAERLGEAGHALFSSSTVLMLRKASASSSKPTSTTRSEAYQASIFLPPPARNAARFSSTLVLTSAKTGWGWLPVLATARSLSPKAA